MLIEDICKHPESWRDEIVKMQKMTAPIILFGAGNTREFNLQYFRDLGIYPVAFCDNSPSKIGGKLDDLEILSFDKVKERYPNAYFYITTQMYYRELYEQILAAGYEAEQISLYDVIFQLQWEQECMEYYLEHAEAVEHIFQTLTDERSKQVLRNRLLFLRTRERKYALEVREYNQYFSEELIDFSKVECFVDLGMYTGDTVLQFADVTKGCYKVVYGFEPDDAIYRMAQENLRSLSNIALIKKGVSDCDGRVRVVQALGVMQTIESGVFGEEGEENSFEICKLDTYFENQNVLNAVLKLDIEGAEMAALRGAKEWIKRSKPIIAICVYHKQEDILEIPALCRQLVPEYKLYMRHYSDNQTETVCYLIP